MILQSLVKYYETLENKGEIAKLGWCKAKVSFELVINKDGLIIGMVPLKIPVTKGKKIIEGPRILEVPAQTSKCSPGTFPNFICDNASYILGVNSLKNFEASRDYHLKILENYNSPAATAVKLFFQKWIPSETCNNSILEPYFDELKRGENLIFGYDDKFVQEDDAICDAWNWFYNMNVNSLTGICQVTGKNLPIARTHGEIRGVWGTRANGVKLVSFNVQSFESYEKKQSYNASVSEYAAFAYTTVLNQLLSDSKHAFHIGDSTVIFWAETAEEKYRDKWMMALNPASDNEEVLTALFQAVQQGQAVDMDGISFNTRFCILGLAPNAARISVRFFYEDTFGTMVKNIMEHYERLEIVRPVTDTVVYLPVWKILNETVNKN